MARRSDRIAKRFEQPAQKCFATAAGNSRESCFERQLGRHEFLNQVLEARRLSQADAAKVLGVTQPKVSALRHYKLAGFSLERLMNLLMALDQDVEIVIRRKPRSRKAGRIRAPGGSFNGSIERDAADDLHVSVERPPPHPSEGNRAPRGRQIRPSPPSNRLCATSDRIRLTRNQHRGSKAVSARSFKRHLTRHWSKW
ncbi:MAG: hypothetical protein DMF94_22490 [Acidobacteria bacterium]|nr:MAG: hypothetical protein DMF94_22490 [Acidobacteriota bacterium]